MNSTYSKEIQNKTFSKNNQSDLVANNQSFDTILYKNCNLQDFEYEGGTLDSNFEECYFKNVFYYWTLFNIIEFIECDFNNCTFSGVSFADCKFIKCTFKNCKFIKDNLGGDCDFNGSTAYQCNIDKISFVGFNIKIDNEYEDKIKRIRKSETED